MRVIVLYGPIAVGKLTTAKELAKLTGFKVFHNHLTVDLAELVYPPPKLFNYSHKLRIKVFKDAARTKNVPGIIFTSCYTGGDGIAEISRVVRAQGVRVNFVQLTASRQALLRRVKSASRENFGKMRDPERLKEALDSTDFFKRAPLGRHLKIDSTKIKPKKAAKMIFDYYKL